MAPKTTCGSLLDMLPNSIYKAVAISKSKIGGSVFEKDEGIHMVYTVKVSYPDGRYPNYIVDLPIVFCTTDTLKDKYPYLLSTDDKYAFVLKGFVISTFDFSSFRCTGRDGVSKETPSFHNAISETYFWAKTLIPKKKSQKAPLFSVFVPGVWVEPRIKESYITSVIGRNANLHKGVVLSSTSERVVVKWLSNVTAMHNPAYIAIADLADVIEAAKLLSSQTVEKWNQQTIHKLPI